jgi:hypothetical protein
LQVASDQLPHPEGSAADPFNDTLNTNKTSTKDKDTTGNLCSPKDGKSLFLITKYHALSFTKLDWVNTMFDQPIVLQRPSTRF